MCQAKLYIMWGYTGGKSLMQSKIIIHTNFRTHLLPLKRKISYVMRASITLVRLFLMLGGGYVDICPGFLL